MDAINSLQGKWNNHIQECDLKKKKKPYKFYLIYEKKSKNTVLQEI